MDSRIWVAPILVAMLATFSVVIDAADEPASAAKFSFSSKSKTDAANQATPVQTLVSAPCQARLKNKRILLLIGEQTPGQWRTSQERYGPLFHVIESRLKSLGLRTYTQQEIKSEIAPRDRAGGRALGRARGRLPGFETFAQSEDLISAYFHGQEPP